MKRIGIEAFLAWAYRDELPKAETSGGGDWVVTSAGGWDAVSRQGELMADLVNDGRINSYGVVPLPASYGAPPHPDALTLHAAVSELAAMELDVPDGWSPLAGLGLTTVEAQDAVRRAMPRVSAAGRDGRLRFCQKPAELLRRHAILGGAPSWEFDRPKARFVSSHGKPLWFRQRPVEGAFGKLHMVEVDGYNARAGRPYAGAYRKTILVPDPAEAVPMRAEYEVWHAALGVVVDTLAASCALHDHAVVMTERPARPWE